MKPYRITKQTCQQCVSAHPGLCVLPVCVFALVPFEGTPSSPSIPVSVKRAKTRRENTMVSASTSANGDAILSCLWPRLRVHTNISSLLSSTGDIFSRRRSKIPLMHLPWVGHGSDSRLTIARQLRDTTHTHKLVFSLSARSFLLRLSLVLSLSLCVTHLQEL